MVGRPATLDGFDELVTANADAALALLALPEHPQVRRAAMEEVGEM